MAVVRVDPEFAAAIKARGLDGPRPKVETAAQYRAGADAFIKAMLDRPLPASVTETKYIIKSYDGAELELYRFVRADLADSNGPPQPAFIHAHGGGVVACPIATCSRNTPARYAAEAGIPIFSVEYRLAPEHPYPTPLEDCYAALSWVSEHAAELNIDPARIGLVGESGGGCLMSGLALLARDRGFSPPVAKQVLVYPMLDHALPTKVQSDHSPRGQLILEGISGAKVCWEAYLGGAGDSIAPREVAPYASVATAKDVAGLPPAYIDVGSLDPFRDECMEYATKLMAAGVDVELHIYDGLPHIFELLAPELPVSRNAGENRLRAMRI